MSSKGAMISGTDGTDHFHRQKIASHYQTSAINKSRLRFSIFMHILLFILMMIKLSDDILDRLDIFILELQGLYIPKPLAWEWIWSSSVSLTFIAKRAMKKNSVSLMKLYGVLIFLMSLSPILYAFGYFFNDFYSFVLTKDIKQVSEQWQKYPLALLWYVFLAISFQVHISQIIFAFILTQAWSVKKGKKE